VEDVNRLLKQYEQMRKMMKQMKNMGKKGGKRRPFPMSGINGRGFGF
jgi:signal recognition particle subunit SRP54